VNACGSECVAWAKDRMGLAWRSQFAAADGWPVTAPVGSFPATGWGLFDMAGNVWEWTSTQYCGPYSPGVTCTAARVGRGGSWDDSDPRGLRATKRLRNEIKDRYVGLGFRCAR
jgi:formylglycine-generating enzyme required for sulfatase activity